MKTNYVTSSGDHTADPDFSRIEKSIVKSDFFLTSVYVENEHTLPVIVVFGDSITDGAHSTIDQNGSWPSQLQTMLLHDPHHRALILNEAIGGNRLVHNPADSDDQTGVMRFNRDALSHADIAAIVLLEGINDIGTSTGNAPQDPEYPVTAKELIQGMKQLIAYSHVRKIKIYGGTLTPYAGARYYSERGEAIRTEVNAWIRSSGEFDGVVDFDQELQDRSNKGHLRV